MSEIILDEWSNFTAHPSFSEVFDQLKQQMIDNKANKAQYIGKGEFLLFNDENIVKEPPCAQ